MVITEMLGSVTTVFDPAKPLTHNALRPPKVETLLYLAAIFGIGRLAFSGVVPFAIAADARRRIADDGVAEVGSFCISLQRESK